VHIQRREADPDGFHSWVEVRRTINDVDHQTDLLGGSGDAERT
jgi:hypothetical protein